MSQALPFPCAFRPAEARDHPFIFGVWLESYKNGGAAEWLRSLRWSRYCGQQTEVIRSLLRDSVCIVACLPDDDGHLLGFACGTRVDVNVLHYVHVRFERRRHGLATELIERCGDGWAECSHLTRAGQHIANRMCLVYNPLNAMVAT